MQNLSKNSIGILATLLVHPIAADEWPGFGAIDGLSFQHRHQLLGYNAWNDVSTDAPYNTGNVYARLADRSSVVELRSDLSLRGDGACEFSLAPRFRFDSQTGVESGSSDEDDIYIRSGGLVCAIGQAWDLRVGRNVLAWGSATFRGPANPFFTDSGQTDPVRELIGRDLIQLGWRGNRWSFAGMIVGDANERNNQQGAGDAAVALRSTYTASNYNVGLVLSKARDESLRWSAYSTLTATGSLILYSESTLRQSSGLYPTASESSPLGWQYVENEDRLALATLFGAAYTFESGWTLTSEVLFDDAGYSDQDYEWSEQSFNAANDVLSQAPGEDTQAAGTLIGQALQPGLSILSKRTLFLQLQRSEWANRADFALRFAWDVDRSAGDLAASLTYFMTPRWEFLALGVANNDRSVNSRVLDSSLLLGVRTNF